MKGDYSLVNANTSAAITGAMAWKDQISGNYQINVRTDKDAGMWSFKISEAQYNAFKNGTDENRAKMLTTLIPLRMRTSRRCRLFQQAAFIKICVSSHSTIMPISARL